MPGPIPPAARDTEGACSCRRDPTKALVPPFLCRGAGLTRLALAPPPASSCGRSFRRAYSALQVDEQQRDRGGSNARDARGLSDRLRVVFVQFLLHFDRPAPYALVIEIARQSHPLPTALARRFFLPNLGLPPVI